MVDLSGIIKRGHITWTRLLVRGTDTVVNSLFSVDNMVKLPKNVRTPMASVSCHPFDLSIRQLADFGDGF